MAFRCRATSLYVQIQVKTTVMIVEDIKEMDISITLVVDKI